MRNRTQTASRHDDVRRESSVTVVSGHELATTDCGSATYTGDALTTWDDCRHAQHTLRPFVHALATTDDPAGDLVPEDEREWMTSRHPLVGEADVRVTDPAARHLDEHLACSRLEWADIDFLQGATDRCQAVAKSILNGNHGPSLPSDGLSVHLRTTQPPFPSSRKSHARANRMSRSTVASDRWRTSAISR